jgi:hypothetical protein
MCLLKYSILLACLFLHIVNAKDIEGSISLPPKKKFHVPEGAVQRLLADARVSVVKDGSLITTVPVSTSGGFTIRSLDDGEYIVMATHPVLQFDPVLVTLNPENITARLHDLIRPISEDTAYPLKFVPVSIQSPYMQEEEFNIFQILKNPMVIMGLFMLVMVWLMPKMQAGLSPEEMSNMRRELEQEGGIAASLLKNMIPADKSGNGNSKVSGAIPSISNLEQKKTR